MRKFLSVVIFFILACGWLSAGYDFSKIKKNVSEFTISNGLKFILLEDHSVPIATFVTYANVGSVDERIGIWGISHFLEHMAFKGTSEVGTTNNAAEKEILAKMDILFDKIREAKNSISPDLEQIKKMEEELDALGKEAGKYVVDNEFINILKQNGVVGLNAGTGMDSTVYFYSLPSNRVELWAYLESSRFSDPFFREFYKERGVIKEERRVSNENQPVVKMIEEMLAIAFKNHPYHTLGIGPMSNIENITRDDMKSYFQTNYNAGNIVIGVSGDIYPDQLKKLAEQYFTKLKPGKRNPRIFTVEPPQAGEKSITIYEESQPWLMVGYHCPSELDKDFAKFSVLDRIITSGRSSRLNKKMVIADKSALAVFSFAGLPGSKYPGLYLVGALPNSGHTTTELLEAIDKEIELIKKESVTQEELDSAKTRIKKDLISRMKSNDGLLNELLGAEIKQGSWQKVFEELDSIDKITTNDIQELVKTYLTNNNRSIARIEKKEEVQK